MNKQIKSTCPVPGTVISTLQILDSLIQQHLIKIIANIYKEASVITSIHKSPFGIGIMIVPLLVSGDAKIYTQVQVTLGSEL